VQSSAATTQTGATLAGMAGFRWHDVLITKEGNIVQWYIDNKLVDTVDMTNFLPANVPTGSNILFGMSDTSLGAGTPASAFQTYDFTLIDNVVVTPEPASAGLHALAVGGVLGRRGRRLA
jgi:hypothetical protein